MPTFLQSAVLARTAAVFLAGCLTVTRCRAAETEPRPPQIALAALTPWPASGSHTVPLIMSWGQGGAGSRHEVQVRWSSGPWLPLSSEPVCGESLTLAAPLPAAGRARTVRVRVRTVGETSATWTESEAMAITSLDDRALAVRYEGQWRAARGGAALGVSRSETRSASVRFASIAPFASRGALAWLATMGPDRGIAEVRLDGGDAVKVDLYAPVRRGVVLAYVSTPLEPGALHELEIEVHGRHNAAATDSLVDIDGVVVLDGEAQPGGPSLGPTLLGILDYATGGQMVRSRGADNPLYEIHDDFEVIGGEPPVVEEGTPHARQAKLEAGGVWASPNPSRGPSRLLFRTESGEWVRLVVLDAQGRVVRKLIEGAWAGGLQSAIWDGRDERGSHVPPGVYFASLHSRTRSAVQSIVMVP